MKILNRLIMILLVVIIPFAAVALSANAMTRLPDIYNYEFNRSQIIEEIGLAAEPTELAQLFSSYLTGKIPEFQLVAEYQGREKQVFTMKDQIGMHSVRSLLNVLLLLAVLALILGGLLCYYLIRKWEKELVRDAFKYSVIFFLIFWFAALTAFAAGILGNFMQKIIFIGGFDAESVLGIVLSPGFFRTWFTFNFIGASLIIFVLGTIIWKFTKERRMFLY